MRASRSILVGAVLAATIFLAVPARAGGGRWSFDGKPEAVEPAFVPGDQVNATASLWLEGVGTKESKGIYWAGPEHGPFFGYVVPRKDAADWGPLPPPLPEDAMYVGEVVFTETEDSRLMDVSLDFVMPDLQPGYYALLYCNDPCTRQIGDTMTTQFTVVEDQGQAFLAGRVDRLDAKLFDLRYLVQHGKNDRVRPLIDRLETRIESLEKKVLSLEGAAALAERGAVATSRSTSLPWAIIVAAPLFLSLLIAARWLEEVRRRRIGADHAQATGPLPHH